MLHVLLLGYVLKIVPLQNQDTCATSYSRIQSRRKFKQLAWTCVHLERKKHMYTHTHTHISLYLSVWKTGTESQSVSSNRWLPCLRQRPSTDSKLTTAAKVERDETQENQIYFLYMEWMSGKTNEDGRKFYPTHTLNFMTILCQDASALNLHKPNHLTSINH